MCYSDETKAAVMAALLTGQSVSSVATEYQIPRGTVATWSAKLDRSPQTTANTKNEVGDLLVDYLRAALITLRKQVEAFGDEDWIKRQPASEAAVLHGVIADKTIRLIAALGDDSAETVGDSTQAVEIDSASRPAPSAR